MVGFKHLRAVVFDWAGTVVDHGSKAPVGVFVEVFEHFGVRVTDAEARLPMGLPKLDHVKALGRMPRVAAAWQARHGRPFGDDDAKEIYAVFVPANRAVVARHADLIPGTADTVAGARASGLKIGSTTGYARAIMEPLLPLAAAQGFAPDNLVCADDLPVGRPSPLMMYRCFLDLGVWPASAVVKVDDTAPGIAEGINAGCWTVGVALTGNALGLDAEELAGLDNDDRARRRERARRELVRGGAHLVVDGIADLMPALDTIEGRIARGKRP